MSTITKSKGRIGLFQDSHIIEYGLAITERDIHTKEVISVRCNFCSIFGREEKNSATRQRQQTTLIKYFKRPFRAEHYRRHVMDPHPAAWSSYQALPLDAKLTHFDDKIQHTNTISTSFGPAQTPLNFDIDRAIVDVIIGDMFFHPDDHGQAGQKVALKLFNKNENADGYKVIISNPLQFQLIIDFIVMGLSFRQVVATLLKVKTRAGLARIGSINDTHVANLARVVCGINLQILSQILCGDIWAFSLANDASTHQGKSYFDNRVRIYHGGKIYNLHVLAIPMYERHTADNMTNLVRDVFDIICPAWKSKLLGVTSDGANAMTGRIQGVVTQLENTAIHQIYRVWCGLHQLDLVMKHAYKDIWAGEFVSDMKAIITHLHQQNNLISDMQSTCPKLSTRWIIMGNVCT